MSLKTATESIGLANGIIYYVPSALLEYYIRQEVKKNLRVHPNYIVDVTTKKELVEAKLDGVVQPLMCDKWLVHIDCEKMKLEDITTTINEPLGTMLMCYWVKDYKMFMKLQSLEVIKKHTSYYPVHSFSRMESHDLFYYHDKVVKEENQLDRALLRKVSKTYKYDVPAICLLMQYLNDGKEVTNERDIVKLVGLGGINVSGFTFDILKADVKTERKVNNRKEQIMAQLYDLSSEYEFSTMYNFMTDTIDGFIEIKQMEILGLWGKPNMVIPNGFNEKRIKRLKRYGDRVVGEITLPRLLTFKQILASKRGFDVELNLIESLNQYLEYLEEVQGG